MPGRREPGGIVQGS